MLEKISGDEELTKLVFYFEHKKEMITFRCIYKHSKGKLHSFKVDNLESHENASPKKNKMESNSLTVKVKYLLSIKFYFKSKIVGLECRIKTDKGTQL